MSKIQIQNLESESLIIDVERELIGVHGGLASTTIFQDSNGKLLSYVWINDGIDKVTVVTVPS